MALTSPSRAAIPPASFNSSAPPSLSESNQKSERPAPSNSSTTFNSTLPPLSPPFAVPDAPPPSTPEAMPPLTLSPPLPQMSPPPSPPLSPPLPQMSPPPYLPLSPPPPPSPVTLPRPPLPVAYPPAKKLPAPPDFTPPPTFKGSPSEPSPVPQVTTPPPPSAVIPTPPSPVGHPLPPSSITPPAPIAKSPANTHPLPDPPPSGSPPVPSAPSMLSPPPISSPVPPNDSSLNESSPPSPLPTVPTEKPTARSTSHDPTTTKSVAPRNAGGLGIGGVVAIGIAIGFLALSLALLAVWSRQRHKRKGSDISDSYTPPSPSASSQFLGSSVLRPEQPFHQTECTSGTKITYPPETGSVGYSKSGFSYEELADATCGFSASNLLGEGGFGCVYKGVLADRREVAIKQLKIGGVQGGREFKTEVEIISRVHHRHVVSLVGYCIAEHERLLVYDYVPNNTLHHHLHDEGRRIMDWVTRVKVAAGAARGLAYLHEDCHPRIIHRDIKSSNILLDYNFDAQVGDFGLAKLALDAYTHVTTRVMGTFGYMAPEYASSGKLTEKSDVFSFGVVLLEVITGRKPVVSSQPLGAESLVAWARPLLTQALDKQDIKELVDPKLGKNFAEHEMFRMIEVAAACVRHLAAKRPRMSQVVRALDSMFEFSDLTNGMKPGQSETFNSREQSAQMRILQRMAFGNQDYSSDFFNHSQSSWL